MIVLHIRKSQLATINNNYDTTPEWLRGIKIDKMLKEKINLGQIQ